MSNCTKYRSGKIKDTGGSNSILSLIHNDTSETMQMHWIDSDGVVTYNPTMTFGPGSKMQIGDKINRPSLITKMNGACYGVLYLNKEKIKLSEINSNSGSNDSEMSNSYMTEEEEEEEEESNSWIYIIIAIFVFFIFGFLGMVFVMTRSNSQIHYR